MKVLTVRNVNVALGEYIRQLAQDQQTPSGEWSEATSRNGRVIKCNMPVTTVYLRPTERVLLDHTRDSNPFFSYLESLWMLDGRNDLEFPAYYAKNIANFSDDGETLNGAYGHRWRTFFGEDQLRMIIEDLSKNPDSRRAVLGMWNPMSEDDLDSDVKDEQGKFLYYEHASDLTKAAAGSRDVPCNVMAVFQVRKGFRRPAGNSMSVLGYEHREDLTKDYLDITVYNRSNDAIWGAYGANAVHFAVLQEYTAYALGVEIGTYYQVANNFHTYLDLYQTGNLLVEKAKNGGFLNQNEYDPYAPRINSPIGDSSPRIKAYPLFDYQPSPDSSRSRQEHIDHDLSVLFNSWDKSVPEERIETWGQLLQHRSPNETPLFLQIAVSMIVAYEHVKLRDYQSAVAVITELRPLDLDWRVACLEWLQRRLDKQLKSPTKEPA